MRLPGSRVIMRIQVNKTKKTPWPDSASELYRPSDRRLLAKLVPTFADRGCHVVSVTDPYGRILGFLEFKLIHGLNVGMWSMIQKTDLVPKYADRD
jgi:CBS-domain-containing membrane protein